MQEARNFQINAIAKKLKHFNHVGLGRDGSHNGEHCPIFVDSSHINVTHSETKWFGATPDVPTKLPGSQKHRIYTLAQIELQNSERVSIFNTHFDEKSNERRHTSMEQLLQQVDLSVPTIVMGDFNARRSNEIFKDIDNFGLRFAHDENCGGTTHGFSRKTNPHAIDHILVSKHFTVDSADVIRRRAFGMLPSDHWPVVAHLSIA